MTWNVFLTRTAYKQFRKLPRRVQELADLAVLDLEANGAAPQGWDVRKTGNQQYRLRLNYRYRMRYRMTAMRELEIEVFFVGHRRDAYR